MDEKVDAKAGNSDVKPGDSGPSTGTPDDINKLKSVYDKMLSAKGKELEQVKAEAEAARAELDLAKKDVPEDKAAAIAHERELQKREAALKVAGDDLQKERLKVAALTYVVTAKSEFGVDIDVAELQKFPSVVEMEAAMLKTVLSKVSDGKKSDSSVGKKPAVVVADEPRVYRSGMNDALTDLFRKNLPNFRG